MRQQHVPAVLGHSHDFCARDHTVEFIEAKRSMMQPFIHDGFLLTNQYAEKLYHDYAANYPKHFRRILCNVLGKDIEDGLIQSAEALLKSTMESICYYNVKKYLGLKNEALVE